MMLAGLRIPPICEYFLYYVVQGTIFLTIKIIGPILSGLKGEARRQRSAIRYKQVDRLETVRLLGI